MAFQIDEEKTQKTIETILEKIHSEADPHLLNKYRSLINRNVSFFRRSYVGAYLLMQLEEPSGGAVRSGGTGRRSGRKPEKTPQTEVSREPRSGQVRLLSEEESTRLFISVGRNRRVFPREILGLINSKTEIPREDIGVIRILDNYSFIQVRTTAADAVIEALNGASFRGRPLTVNYARSQEDNEKPTVTG